MQMMSQHVSQLYITAIAENKWCTLNVIHSQSRNLKVGNYSTFKHLYSQGEHLLINKFLPPFGGRQAHSSKEMYRQILTENVNFFNQPKSCSITFWSPNIKPITTLLKRKRFRKKKFVTYHLIVIQASALFTTSLSLQDFVLCLYVLYVQKPKPTEMRLPIMLKYYRSQLKIKTIPRSRTVSCHLLETSLWCQLAVSFP